MARRLIALRAGGVCTTLLAVCPNSDAVLEAAVKAAAANAMPMLLAATLNQVDRDGGYTRWTPQGLVDRMRELSAVYQCSTPLYPCLDHGGPWLKDAHTHDSLNLEETMSAVKATLTACLEAGYTLFHIDATVDRTLPAGQPPPIDVVVERTVELIAHVEAERVRRALPAVCYEAGTEEVHGGLADFDTLDRFLTGLFARLQARGLAHAWPCFIVGKVGTDLHTTTFNPDTAHRLTERLAPLGSLLKGHYTDWVANPADYPASGMGGANVGPELTATELAALYDLCAWENRLVDRDPAVAPSCFKAVLEAAVVNSNRWRKWLTAKEGGREFDELPRDRREWLVATCARYVWTDPQVLTARGQLYANLRSELPDPNAYVVERIAQNIQVYVDAFNLKDAWFRLTE